MALGSKTSFRSNLFQRHDLSPFAVRETIGENSRSLPQALAGLAKYYHRSPERISEAEVQSYLLYLRRDRELAWSSCNIVRYGLKFFYHHTLKRREVEFQVPAARHRCGGEWEAVLSPPEVWFSGPYGHVGRSVPGVQCC
jgi:hypothetical protein